MKYKVVVELDLAGPRAPIEAVISLVHNALLSEDGHMKPLLGRKCDGVEVRTPRIIGRPQSA